MVDIKDISGNIRFSTPINEGSKRKFQLMKEDYILLKFSLASPVYFQLGDWIDNEIGMFELVDLYKPVYNTTTGAYDYELRLDAYYWKWKNKKFFYTPETTGREAGWNLTAPLDTHLNVFLDNLKALGYKFREEEFTYEIDDTVAGASKLVSYDNVNLIDALTQMAETWECEWWITENVIHFGRCEYGSPVDFKAGDLTDTENVNVNSMPRSDSQTAYATRIYAFGSTRNIPASYRKSLIFDVKEVDGRDMSDTARPLKEDYFPLSSVSWNRYPFEGGAGGMIFSKGETVGSATVTPSLPAGTYYLKRTSDWVLTLSPLPVAGASVSKGRYDGNLSILYDKGDETLTLYSAVLSFQLDSDIYESTSGTFDAPDVMELEIPENASNLRVELRCVVTSDLPLISTVHFGASLSLEIRAREKNADTSVSFLSGARVGETFSAACVFSYDGNGRLTDTLLRLPEGVTASLGDRYTIGNIIKGKVPDNYFSKDDKELTLNGVVQKRLMLPEGVPYVDAYRYGPTGERVNIGDENYDDPDNVEMPEEEAIEEIVIFEDEYPKYTGSISSVSYDERDEKDEDGNGTGNKYRVYTFKDTGLKNFTKDFLLDELRLIFQTGKLAGLDFALTLKESDDTGTTFEIVRNDDYGRALPDDVLFPQAAHTENGEDVPADTYILYGFDTAFISEQTLPDAERNLLKKAKEYVRKSMTDPSTYDCEMDADFIYNNGNIRTYEVGAKVNLINKAYFPEGRQSRIIGFEWSLDIPYDHPVYTVGETAAYSRIGEIESKLDSLTYKGQAYSGSVVGGGGTGVYVIGVNDRTLPSDRNVFSSQKSLATFLNKTREETMDYLIRLLGGAIIDNISSQNFISGPLGTGFLVKRDPKTGRSYIEVDEIYVRLKAIFESLTVKELQSAGGEILLTPAGIECAKVETITEAALYDADGARLYGSDGAALYASVAAGGVYRCYFTADDGEKAVVNQFAAGDMAQCRQFNIKEGAYENVSNRYYWRYVVAVGDDYIDLSVNDCAEGSDIPRAGDKIIQLGNRTDPARQNAILLSACGLTAPTIQMLQGINSYSLDGKAVREEGFDRETSQFYSNIYGRSYTGARDKGSYIQYTPDKGVEVRGSVTLETPDGKVWSVDSSDGVNRVGDLNGRHVEINPNSCDVRIYNEENVACAIMEGRKYGSVSEIYGAELPTITPLESSDMRKFMANIDTDIAPVTESASKRIEFNPLEEERFDVSNEVTLQYVYSYDYTLVYNGRATGSIGIRLEAVRYGDGDDGTPAESYVLLESVRESETGGDVTVSSIKLNLTLPKAGRYALRCALSAQINPSGSGDGRLVARVRLNSLRISAIRSGYASRFFSNGLVFGDKETNLFSLMNRDYDAWGTYLEGGFENESAGIRITNTMLLGKSKGVMSQDEGFYGIIPRILASGVISGGTSGAHLSNARTVDGTALTVQRLSTGVYRVGFPDEWSSIGNLDYYVMLTGYGRTVGSDGPVKATVKSVNSGSFVVELSDDATPRDGACFFEVKLY